MINLCFYQRCSLPFKSRKLTIDWKPPIRIVQNFHLLLCLDSDVVLAVKLSFITAINYEKSGVDINRVTLAGHHDIVYVVWVVKLPWSLEEFKELLGDRDLMFFRNDSDQIHSPRLITLGPETCHLPRQRMPVLAFILVFNVSKELCVQSHWILFDVQ